jgi:hypothetical protein
MKYALISLMFLAGNEIVSYIALCVMSVMLLCDLIHAREVYR